ncbi:MAG: hypothetical protein D5R97_02595 [Candidatus Syntrophonatronum acetioxidans]|uniref:Sialidase domain-containing protein n=1 Tax=Candidatus Syntrophonatronum acetioxidans TaxID=1795816 RepID=A0A424YH00_9FIRM|nr:MAG: hypothetical protein D5R97_02595 [Candidatus Syntrophonatronum acetioxidans]
MDNYLNKLNCSPFLLNNENKEYWLFFLDNFELNYLYSSDGGINWSKEKSVSETKINSFSLTLDNLKNIHIIGADQDNSILHLKKRNKNWEKNILRQASEKIESSFFTLLPGKDILHLFYRIFDLKEYNWYTIHQIYSKETWREERILERGSGPGNNYFIACPGLNERIHTIQIISKNKEHFLYYRSLDPDTLTWTGPIQVSPQNDGCFYPCILEDPDNNLHLLWSLLDENEFKILYRKKSFGGWPSAGWKNPEILGQVNNNTSAPFPFMWLTENNLLTIWFYDECAWYINSEDGGDKWNPVQKQKIKQSYLIRYYQSSSLNLVQGGHYIIAREFPPHSFFPSLTRRDSLLNLTDKNSYRFPEEPLQKEKEEVEEDVEVEEETLEKDLEYLKGCSTRLLSHAVHLEEDRNYYKKVLEKKQREFSWFYKKAEDQVNELNKTISSKDSQLTKLEKQLEKSFKIINEGFKTERMQFKKEKKTLELEINSLNQENKQLKEKIKKINENAESLKNHLKQRENLLNNLQLELTRLQQETREGKGWWEKIKDILNKHEAIKKKKGE